MLKSSSRGAIGSVVWSTSLERVEVVDEVEEVDIVLRALGRRRGCWFELKNMLACFFAGE